MSPAEAELMMHYIPPPGAMQFEVTNESTTVKGITFWVTPLKRGTAWTKTMYHCDCCVGFLVIPETLPEPLRSLQPKDHRDRVVCSCTGRIIE